MRRTLSILLLGCTLQVAGWMEATAFAYITPQDNDVWVDDGDSLLSDGDATSPQTGQMEPLIFASWLYLTYPQLTNQDYYNFGQSGSNMGGQANTEAKLNVPVSAFNALRGIGTNSSRLIWTIQASGNGSYSSNQMLLAGSNNMQAPSWLTNGTANTNEGGWCATNFPLYVGYGDASYDGDFTLQSEWGRNNAITNAAARWGVLAIDCYGATYPYWLAYNNAGTQPPLLYPASVGAKQGHNTDTGSTSWAFSKWRAVTQDTNIANIVIDWNAAVPVSTNQCVITACSRTGNKLTFTVHKLRYAPAVDIAGTADWLGNVSTNDGTAAYTAVNTNDANFWQDTLAFQNLPSGHYTVIMSNAVLTAGLSDSVFTTGLGWNMATNANGPIRQIQNEVLGRLRDLMYANRVTLVQGNSGDGVGIPGLGSLISGKWPTEHGDGLITDSSVTNYLWHLHTNSTSSFAAIRAPARPADFQVTVELITPRFVPFHL